MNILKTLLTKINKTFGFLGIINLVLPRSYLVTSNKTFILSYFDYAEIIYNKYHRARLHETRSQLKTV